MKLVVLSRSQPYARVILRYLRDRRTPYPLFRSWLRRAGWLLGLSLAADLRLVEVDVETPLGAARELELPKQPLIVNILGAGEFLVQGILDVYPGAPLGFIATKRVEKGEDVSIKVLYERLPREWRDPAIIGDPMLATGGTLSYAIGRLKSAGADPIIVATVIAAPEGLERLEAEYGDSAIVYTLAVDERLNKEKFIVPGLGDAGDRSLGVEF
ncbi:MAG: uracil phosphoribosyltransferase [Desulfurococcales archaeon]|nr:uracil phosphoribosyltransferase [Desulfurococcales archaeon]